MNSRLAWLGGVTLVGAILAVALHIAGGWGKITIHARNVPLNEVVRSVERQGGIQMATDLDGNTPITLWVTRVPLAEALEALSAATDGRVNLAFFLGPDRAAARGLVTAFERGDHSALELVRFGGPLNALPGASATDPRGMIWKPAAAEPSTLGEYLKQAALQVDALFIVPNTWDPPANPPNAASVGEAVRALAGSAGGTVEEYFVLAGSDAPPGGFDGPEGQSAGASGPLGRAGGAGFGLSDALSPGFASAMAQRAENVIAQLPPEQRDEARKDWERMKELWEEMATLPPEERRERMEDPELQERMRERMDRRDMQSPPEKRRDRYERYLDRKLDRKYNDR